MRALPCPPCSSADLPYRHIVSFGFVAAWNCVASDAVRKIMRAPCGAERKRRVGGLVPPIKCLRWGWFHPWAPGRAHGVPQDSRLETKREWCGRRDLNPHELLGSTDFHTVYDFRRPDAAL